MASVPSSSHACSITDTCTHAHSPPDGFQKLTTNAIQAVYSSSLPHIRVTATFETERFGQGALVFRVSAIDQEEQ